MPLVEADHLIKSYKSNLNRFGGSGSHVLALDDVSLSIETGETVGLVGESGSGKTTLGRVLLRLVEPDSGTVRFNGADVFSARSKELRELRRDMQIVFQDPYSSL